MSSKSSSSNPKSLSSKKQDLPKTLSKRSLRASTSSTRVIAFKANPQKDIHLESKINYKQLSLKKNQRGTKTDPETSQSSPSTISKVSNVSPSFSNKKSEPKSPAFSTASILDPQLATRELVNPVFPKKHFWLQKEFFQLEQMLYPEIAAERIEEIINSTNCTKPRAIKAIEKGTEPTLLQRRVRVRAFEKLWLEHVKARPILESSWIEVLKLDIYADLEPTKDFVALQMQRLRDSQGYTTPSSDLFRHKGHYEAMTTFSQPLWSTKRSTKDLVSHVLTMVAYNHLGVNLDAVQEQADQQLNHHLSELRRSSFQRIRKKK